MRIVAVILGTLLALWIGFIVVLALARPETATLKESLRLLPQTVRLIRRLATDPEVPRSARLLVWLLVGYLALPIDLVPDLIPVLGYADDLILIVLVLRHLVRRAGPHKLSEHWPGDVAGLQSLRALLRLES